MKKIIYSTIMILTALLILSGCPGDLNIKEKPPAEEGKGFVTLSFGAGGRTLLPATAAFGAIEVVFTPNLSGTQDFREEHTTKTASLSSEYELEVGNWTLELKGFAKFADTAHIATGTAEFDVENGETVAIDVPLTFISMADSEEDGIFQWHITNNNSFPSNVAAGIGSVTQTEVTLISLTGNTDGNRILSGVSGAQNITAGYYWVTVRQERDRITPLETNISNWDTVRAAGIIRSVFDDIVHIYPGHTTRLEHTFGANDYFNGIENVWLVGHNDAWTPQLGTAPEKNSNGTFTWKFQTTAAVFFRFSLTDTTGLTGANMGINRGAWFIPALNNTDVSLAANNSNSMNFIGFNSSSSDTSGYGKAWRLSNSAYYVLTLDPVSRSFNMQTPVELEGVRIITDLTDVSADVTYALSAEATGRNINGGNFTWSVVKDPTEDNPTNITRTAQANTNSYTATSTGSLVIDAKQKVGDLVVNVSYNVGGQTKTDTITLNYKDAKPLAPVTAAWGAANTGNAGWSPHEDEINVASYNVRLFKGSGLEAIAVQSVPVGAAISYVVDFRTKMLESITPEDGSGPFLFTYTVEAVSKNENFLNSIPAVSAERNVTRRSQVTGVAWGRSPAVSGEENGRLFWNNTTETGDYSIQVYRNIGSEKVPVGGPRNAGRGTSYSEYHLANAYIPSDIRYQTLVAVTAKGDPAILQVDSIPAESPSILYTVFGNSKVWTITRGAGAVDGGLGRNYVAGAEGGKIAYSPDGYEWTLSNQTAFTSSVRAIAHNGQNPGVFVAAGHYGRIARSLDGGQTWTAVTTTGFSSTQAVLGVAFGGTRFAAVGDGGIVRYSTDGSSWTTATWHGNNQTFDNNTRAVLAITYGVDRFVAIDAGKTIAQSTDGTNWTWIERATTDAGVSPASIAFGNDKFVILLNGIGDSWGSPNNLRDLVCLNRTSISKDSWVWGSTGASCWSGGVKGDLAVVTYDGNRFLAVSKSSQYQLENISISVDGETWTASNRTEFPRDANISAAFGIGEKSFIMSGNESSGWGKMAIIEIP